MNKEEGEKSEGQIKKGSEKWSERLKGKYPDMDWDNDPEAMYSALDKEDEEHNSSIGKYKDNDEKLKGVFSQSPEMASVFMKISAGKSVPMALFEEFGEDLMALKDDPDKAEEIAEAMKNNAEKLSQGKSVEQEQIKNAEKSASALEDFAKTHNMSDEELSKFGEEVVKLANSVFMCDFNPDMLEKLYKAVNYDIDVQAAAEQGAAQGRNQKIVEVELKKEGDGIPVLGGVPKSPVQIKDKVKRGSAWDAFNKEKK